MIPRVGLGEASPTYVLTDQFLHGLLRLTLLIASLVSVALVMLFFAFGEADFEFDAAAFVMQIERHHGVSALLDFANELVDFALVEQQFARAHRIGVDVGGGFGQGGDVRADQIKRATLQHHVTFFELCATGADGFDLPAFEHESGFIAFFDEIVKKRFFVFGNGHSAILSRRGRHAGSKIAGMAHVAKSVLVPHSVDLMFDLVDDVEHYPDFLPWCGGSRVQSRDDLHTLASLDIRYGGVAQTLTTRNAKLRPRSMLLTLVEGPFRTLTGTWHFTPLTPAACKVELVLDYTFGNAAVEAVIGPVMAMIAETLIDRFVQRADDLYSIAKAK